MNPATKTRKKSEKDIEIHIPNNAKSYLDPGALLLASLLVCVAIVFSFKPGAIGLTLGAKDSNTISGDSAGFENFKLGAISGKVSTFTEYDNEPCSEGGKPVVFMFSATWCPHCQWMGETFNEWAINQDDVVAYRYEIDTGDNPLTPEEESEIPAEHKKIYEAFNPNQSIPTYVFACKYGRIGNGFESEDDGLKKEVEEFDTLIKELI